MGAEEFLLCWDSFHSHMASGMHALLESEDLVDVTLAVEGQYLKAHKMVLSVCSPYFHTLFNMNPCKHPIVFLKDVSYATMSNLLTFMYQGEAKVHEENLDAFIKTGEALQIKGLTDHENRTETKAGQTTPQKRRVKIVRQYAVPSKRPKVSCAPPNLAPIAPTIKTEIVELSKLDTEETSTKANTFERPADDESATEQIDDSMVEGEDEEEPQFVEESVEESQEDESADYTLIESELDPRPGTSGDDTGGDNKDKYRPIMRRKRKQEMPRYIVDGFVFHVNIIKGNPPMTYLRCLEYKRLGCLARAVIPYQGTINDIQIKKEHNHPPDYAAEEKIVFLRELKGLVQKNNPAKEVYNVLSQLYPNAAKETSYESIRAKLNRWKRSSLAGVKEEEEDEADDDDDKTEQD